MDLIEQIRQRRARVAVIGLGYVGLPLALEAAAAGFEVTGFDLDAGKVEGIRRGESPVLDVAPGEMIAQVSAGRFTPTSDAEDIAGAGVVIICVPTPLKQELPDMSFIESAAKEVARVLGPDTLVVLESTTYPGTTEELLKDTLETSGLKAGRDFWLGFSPERIDPGNREFGLRNVPKIVGGLDERSGDLMEAFYGSFVDEVVRVASPRAAEMAKLLENTYRHVNIALVNEIAILCHDLGIDVWEVIDAAATKPFGFQAFYPGPGWGGHCIPVDPAYLSWRVRQMGETAHFIELAREINARMPAYVVQRIGEALNERGRSLKDSSVLILGVAYKPDVADVRESPAIDIIARLLKAGARVDYHDPHIEEVRAGGETLRSAELEKSLAAADIVVVVTDHSGYDWERVSAASKLILDTRNVFEAGRPNVIRP